MTKPGLIKLVRNQYSSLALPILGWEENLPGCPSCWGILRCALDLPVMVPVRRLQLHKLSNIALLSKRDSSGFPGSARKNFEVQVGLGLSCVVNSTVMTPNRRRLRWTSHVE